MPDCQKPSGGGQGMCGMHYLRWKKHGDTAHTGATGGTVEERYRAHIHIDPDTGCWLWTGSDVSNKGYARFHVDGKRTQVHRWSYEHHVRPLLPGEVVDHYECDTPLCSNPDHLRGSSQRSNVLRSSSGPSAVNARRTHCKYGHPFDAANTVVRVHPNGSTSRACRACSNARCRKSRQRK